MKICVDIYLSPYDFFNPRHPVFPLQAYYQGMHPTVLCNQNSHPINNKKWDGCSYGLEKISIVTMIDGFIL